MLATPLASTDRDGLYRELVVSTLPSSEVLLDVATQLVSELGPPHSVQQDYAYPIFPADGSVQVRKLDAAVFTSPSPSVGTALCALAATNGLSISERLNEIGYFGGPLAIVEDAGTLIAYRYRVPRVPTKIESVTLGDALPWVRRTIAREASAAAQLELPLSEGRDVLITDARRGLSRLVMTLMGEFQEAGADSTASAFDAALRAIRSVLFEEPLHDEAFAEIVRPHRDALRFPHVPLEAVAELYETLGLEARHRREHGIAYTPAWIADHLISRLPSTAFSIGPAVDPTCGSGTFLVAYLDRLVTERARRLQPTAAADLVAAVGGMDIDPVALATSRLTLDLFAQRLGHPPQPWHLERSDATSNTLPAAVLAGNLPFGYRTHQGRDDISSVILTRWLDDLRESLESLAILLPDSFAYASGGTAKARAALRVRFRIDELLDLPEEVFDRTSAATLAVVANRGEGDTPVVRQIRRRDLPAFRVSGVPSESFVSQLSPGRADPWSLTPFFSVLERAASTSRFRLGDIADIRLGFQTYGTDAVLAASADRGPTVLEDSKMFMALSASGRVDLRRLVTDPQELRRTGPVDRYAEPKIVLRATTNRHQIARLAALPDEQGLWFTDKFIGVWPRGNALPVQALAAYLQTTLPELWLAANNPSRKLRVGTLAMLPIPSLPPDWWQRATRLAAPNHTTVSPRWARRTLTLLERDEGAPDDDWRWFEQVVALAFGASTSQLTAIERYLDKHLTVGRND
jgi:hypothetical protein